MKLSESRILYLGSSVTWGVSGVSFAEMLEEEYGAVCVKEAVSGTTLADVDDASYVARLCRVPGDIGVDLCLCQLSTNDASRKIDIDLVERAIRFIVGHVREKLKCPVAFYTGTRFESPAYGDMVRLLLALGRELDFPVLDLWNDAGMLSVSPEDYARFMRDPVHPTLDGYREWWLPKFADFLASL